MADYPMKRLARVATAVAYIIITVCVSSCSKDSGSPASSSGPSTITVGVLVDLTGSATSISAAGWVAMGFALDDINASLAASSSPIRLKYQMVDCASSSDAAVAAMQGMIGQGVKVFIGPFTSAAVAAVKPLADSQGCVVISPSSVATSLSIPGDNVFRMAPDDSLQAKAISALFVRDTIRVVIPVYRNDTWGVGLAANTNANFTAMGGTVLTGIAYSATDTNFASTIQTLHAAVSAAVKSSGARRVAVHVMSFDEITALMRLAAIDTVLRSVRWYGASASAKSASILADPVIRDFAMRTGYDSPVFGLDDQAVGIWQPLTQRVRAQTGSDPSIYALTAYDAAWLVARTYLATGGAFALDTWKSALVASASNYYGATGWTAMNANGDRKTGNIDFWVEGLVSGTIGWLRTAQWRPSGQIITY